MCSYKSSHFPNNNTPLGINPMGNFNTNNNMSMNININNMNIMPNMNMMNGNNMGMMNNNMPINNFYLPSNLVGNVIPSYNNSNIEYLTLKFNLNNEFYILKIEKIDSSNSILFSCSKEQDITLLYEFSCLKSFRELHNMNKIFLISDNIGQVFNSIQNILIKEKNIAIPRIDFLQNNKDALVFFFRSPLVSGQIEDISIILQKKERNIQMQFDKLVKQYEKIKEIVFRSKIINPGFRGILHRNSNDNNNKINELKYLINPSWNLPMNMIPPY